MVLIVIVVVAYLVSTRIERSTSSVYANRLRAKIQADGGLAAAIHLLKDNTRYGNYITAMSAPSPSPVAIYTEIYRPTNPTDSTHAVKADDYLRLDNAAGEILVSRSAGGSSPGPDPRPVPDAVPTPLPSASPFALPSPAPALVEEQLPPQISPSPVGNSYNFNQLVRIGLNASGLRLVQPSSTAPTPALGQWVNVRNASGELIGRYAFYIEDESMKMNLNVTGNASPTPRPGDLTSGSFPSPQVQEIDPSGIIPATSSRSGGYSKLIGVGAAGARLSSKATVSLLDTSTWQNSFPSYFHMATVSSRNDVTTAKGWQRLDLNALVSGTSSNTAKIAIAQRIANWMRDAWTGPTPIGNLQSFQMFNDDRLRLQIAANIIDYIDGDNTPTDLGDLPNIGVVPPAANSSGYPIIGIEKIPYIVEVDVIYAATANPDVPGQATIGMSFRLNFFNMFETDLQLGNYVRTIRIKGVPVIVKNGTEIFKHDTDTYEITVGTSGTINIADAIVPWGGDNVPNGVAGAKTFQTGQVVSQSVTYTPGGSITTFESGLLTVDVLDASGNRLDSTRIALRDLPARWDDSTSTDLSHDFLETRNSAAAINGTWEAVVAADGSINPIDFGDPRYRPSVITRRWYNLTRTDTTRFAVNNDQAEVDSRAYSVDWYDYIGDRPLLFHRNGSMLSVGELGNVAVCEYPWRTLYFQYAGRPENTTEPSVVPDIQDRRGSSAAAKTDANLLPQDYALADLFKTSPSNTVEGALNINTQFNVVATPTPAPTATPIINQGSLVGLFLSVPVGGGVPSAVPTPGSTPTVLDTSSSTNTGANIMATIIAGRRNGVAPLSTGGPGTPGSSPPIDNNHRCPYFTIGQISSDMSCLINQSENATMTGNGQTRTSVNYSVLRQTPTSSFWNRNYGTDVQVEEPFRKISNSITTHGNVFRVLYVGQTIKDYNKSSVVDNQAKITAEYLGEAFVERQSVFTPDSSNSDIVRTTDSTYRIVANRVVTE
jgi:hypothetical protein